jgi:signal transduction histidine kinase
VTTLRLGVLWLMRAPLRTATRVVVLAAAAALLGAMVLFVGHSLHTMTGSAVRTVPLDWQAFAIEPLLAHAVREQELSVPDVAIDMQVEDPGLAADGDPERVHQVVANLLENAVRHSPAGAAVQVRARRSDGGVTIEVIDEGPGIAADDVARVFERFYRADSARASSDGGAGLGLAIARWIVDLHGGEIHPEPCEPHGCRMVVTLPRATTVPEPEEITT